jgi:hypothetical protein
MVRGDGELVGRARADQRVAAGERIRLGATHFTTAEDPDMKLFLNAASPYARLVRVVLVETGLQAQTELHYVDPWESPPDLLARNPAAKVPALDLDDGTQLIESGYILYDCLRGLD